MLFLVAGCMLGCLPYAPCWKFVGALSSCYILGFFEGHDHVVSIVRIIFLYFYQRLFHSLDPCISSSHTLTTLNVMPRFFLHNKFY